MRTGFVRLATGIGGDRTSASGNGGRYGRTTAPNGEAWDYLPHDHARSRAYRWGEDGLAGFCDIEQRLCLGLALWNGRDPILKERAFGAGFDQMMAQRRAEADEFYVELTPKDATADEGMVMRQAFGGLLWSKQLFYYDVTRRCQRPGLWPR